MRDNQVDINQWKAFAEQILGRDFFQGFMDQGEQGGDHKSTIEPKYNLYRGPSELIVLINIPYIRDIKSVKLFIKEQELVVKGNISFDYDHLDLVHGQLYAGDFEKRIPLPESVNTKKVNAQYRRGILQVQLFPRLKKNGYNVEIQDSVE